MKLSYLENIDMNVISNIVFDWGGIITNIDFKACTNAFEKLGHNRFEEYFSSIHANSLFQRFEKGQAKPEEIYQKIRKDIGRNISENDMDNAWCKMLLDTPIKTIRILKSLRKKYKIFLLSNTNQVHVEYYTKYMNNIHGIDFFSLFHRVFLSCRTGMRKPDPEIFKYVLCKGNIKAAETLFIDDIEINTKVAEDLGFRTLHLPRNYPLESVFSEEI